MKNKKIIILCITAIVLIISGLLYFSYGFYLTNITGTENSKKLLSLTKVFKFEFSDGTEKLVSNNTNFIPGSVIEKTFTITNKSTEGIYFNIDLDEVTNTFTRTSDIVYEIYYNNEIISSNTFPTTNSSIATNLYIEKDGVREYTLKVKYLNNEENQISDMGKSISANISFSRTDSPITKFNVLGNSYQAIGNGNNLFDERLMEGFGWTKCDDGSYYVENNRNVYQKKLWENTEGYTGQIKVDYLIKYAKSSSESIAGSFLEFVYTDGTMEEILLINNQWSANTWFTPNYHKISNKDKIIDYICFTYGTGFNHTWLKNIMITKNTTSTEYEKYGISPAPDNPSEIESLGTLITDSNDKNYGKYMINLSIKGKNLFNLDGITGNCVANGTVEKISNGYIATGNYGSSTQNTLFANGWLRPGNSSDDAKVFLRSGDTVTISANIKLLENSTNFTTNNNFSNIYLYGSGGVKALVKDTKLKLNTDGTSTRVYETYTVVDTGYYYPIFTLNNNKLEITNIQIEYGNSATDYEPYIEPVNYDVYLNEPLRCVGNTCDYIDLVNKKVVRKINTITFNGTENWAKNTNYSTSSLFVGQYYSNDMLSATKNVISNRFKYSNPTVINSIRSAAKYILIGYDSSLINDEASFKTWLNENNTIVNYELATPTEENISLPDVSEFNGKTLIVSDGNLYSSKIEKE